MVKISLDKKIKLACEYADISQAELGRRLGYSSPQAFSQKLKRGFFTEEEINNICNKLGCEYEIKFKFPDGFEL